ncbi:MAG: hypothetical protein JNK48_01820 [Bryobacterales bacterium]|nr:hypothetical protein [Bryobacterales bacterium]
MQPEITDFCRLVAARVSLTDKSVLAEQVHSALGGISNLYVGKLQQLKVRQLELDTTEGFASEHVPVQSLLTEIGNCTGLEGDERNAVLNALKSTLQIYFTNNGASAVYLGGIGRFTPADVAHSRYHLTAENPLEAPGFRGPTVRRIR